MKNTGYKKQCSDGNEWQMCDQRVLSDGSWSTNRYAAGKVTPRRRQQSSPATILCLFFPNPQRHAAHDTFIDWMM